MGSQQLHILSHFGLFVGKDMRKVAIMLSKRSLYSFIVLSQLR